MIKPSIFYQIKNEDFDRMFHCFDAYIKKCPANSQLLKTSTTKSPIGIILSGDADLIKYDFDGNRSILEHLSDFDIFGYVFLPIDYSTQIEIISNTECKIVYFDYQALIKRCENACECHSTLVNNVLQILSYKTKLLNERLEILSQRSIRGKLLTYFHQSSLKYDSTELDLSFTLASLADYLFVERSAMLREMKKMRDDALIESKGRHIKLL
ncbi:MAG: Crp/Fnr family transcriptional regulator [Anaerostipes sp.]|nr:Crp/Fnr family transcriptional regulator [Anaerostipes sp.]